MTYEDIHNYETYLENLLMAKIAYDAGVPTREMKELTLWTYSGYSTGFSSQQNFVELVSKSFSIVEFYENAEAHEEDYTYWLELADREAEDHEYLGICVILDDSLTHAYTGECGSNMDTDSSASIYQFEQGVIIVYDENYGDPLWSDILDTLYASRDKLLNQQKKEANILEMAT